MGIVFNIIVNYCVLDLKDSEEMTDFCLQIESYLKEIQSIKKQQTKNGQFENAMRKSTEIQPDRRKPRIIPKEPVLISGLNGRKPKANVERILQEFQNKIPEIANTGPKLAEPKWGEPEIA